MTHVLVFLQKLWVSLQRQCVLQQPLGKLSCLAWLTHSLGVLQLVLAVSCADVCFLQPYDNAHYCFVFLTSWLDVVCIPVLCAYMLFLAYWHEYEHLRLPSHSLWNACDLMFIEFLNGDLLLSKRAYLWVKSSSHSFGTNISFSFCKHYLAVKRLKLQACTLWTWLRGKTIVLNIQFYF